MKNFKKLASSVLMFALLGFNLVPIVTSAAEVDVRGNYSLDLTCVTGYVGCTGTVFPHTMSIVTEDLGTGVLTGTGHSVSDPSATWNLTGGIVGSAVTLHALYTGTNAGYTFDLTGTRAINGTMSGTGADSIGDTFTWTTSAPSSLNMATISATKIVCPTENLLPNWGSGGPNVTASTASTFITAHPTCHTEPWNFEWAPEASANPGNNLGAAGGAWTSFTNTASVPAGSALWVREQMKDGYIPFSGATTNLNSNASKNSAEFYCNSDVLNYDNYDKVNPIVAGNTYHCVGFNVPNKATISATKIVCPSEDLLPNWGSGAADITATTASDFITAHPTCHTEPWNFEWAPEASANPGNNLGAAGGAWTPFTSTVLVPFGHKIWVREQMQDGYVPFSGATTNLNSNASKNSAEFYCNSDVLNYDNYDWIDPVENGHTYNCVGFNALKAVEQPQNITVTATKIVCDSETSLPNWGTGDNGAPFEITSSTATDWLGQHQSCHLESGWDFQYGDQSTSAPADTLVGLAPGYTSFGTPTGVDGTTTVNIPITGVTEVHLAEVLKEGYIPFTAQDFPGNVNNVTAEIYCSSDMYNYDNYEGIGADEDTAKIVPGAHYYCVAWNVLKTQIPVDMCPNIPEVQTEIPQGMHINDGQCVPDVVDMCPNILEVQATVPDGMHVNVDGNCVPNDIPQCGPHTLDVVSDDTDQVDGVSATPVASINPGWTANIPGAAWIWNALNDFDSTVSQTKTFTKAFNVVGTPTSATLDIAADNGYDVSINANASVFADPTEFNYNSVDSYNPLSFLTAGANTLAIAVTNMPVPESTFESNPAGLLYKLHIESNDCPPVDQTTGTLIVKKVLVGSDVDPSNFAFKIDGGSPIAFESADGQNDVTVTAGTHSVVELGYVNYTTTYENCTDVNVTVGGTATCTVTNTYVPIVDDSKPVCSDGADNDGDGLTDTNDPACHPTDHNVNNLASYDPNGTSEVYDAPVCSDGKDNDSDELIDSNDPGCHAGGTMDGAYDPNDTDENNGGGGGGGPTLTDNGGGGGGGGGGSGKIAPQGQVLGASTACGIYIDKFLRKGYKNDTEAVKKLQKFLNDYMKSGIKEDGNYGTSTEKAVRKFQVRQSGNVLSPWGFKGSTGIFYLTTQTEVNNIMCPDLKLPIPKLVPIEINPDAPKKK